MTFHVYKLAVMINNGLIERYYERRTDAQTSFDITYQYFKKKPVFKITEIEVINYVQAF